MSTPDVPTTSPIIGCPGSFGWFMNNIHWQLGRDCGQAGVGIVKVTT